MIAKATAITAVTPKTGYIYFVRHLPLHRLDSMYFGLLGKI